MSGIEEASNAMLENIGFLAGDPKFAELITATFQKPIVDVSVKTINLAYKHKNLFEYIASSSRICANVYEAEQVAYVMGIHAAYVEILGLWIVTDSLSGFTKFGLEMHYKTGVRGILFGSRETN